MTTKTLPQPAQLKSNLSSLSRALVIKTYGIILSSAILIHLGWAPFLSAQSTDPRDWSTDLRLFLDYSNMARASLGVSPLQWLDAAAITATKHSEKMASMQAIGHHFPGYPELAERLARDGLYFSVCGENVISSDTAVVKVLHDSLMESAEHRANIVDSRFTHFAAGCVQKGDRHYLTQVFLKAIVPAQPDVLEERAGAFLSQAAGEKRGLAIYPKIRDYLREQAKNKLQELPLDPLPPEFGNAHICVFRSPDWESLLKSCREEMESKDYSVYNLGVGFGRTSRWPGGEYALVLFFSLPLPD